MKLTLEILNKYESDGLLYSQVHPTLPLRIFNYTDKTVYAGAWDDVTLKCRGLVVNTITGDIVARPFSKFFNLSEGRTNVTSSYDIFEKLDGSLGILFFYAGEWILASRGSFTSDQAVKGLFLLSKYDLTQLDVSNTYCFEIIYSENRVVVLYDYEDIILTGVFNTQTGEELSIRDWGLKTVEKVGVLCELEEIQSLIKDEEEGYVIRFNNGERCKIKGKEYLRLHKLMSEMSTTSVWECLSSGTPIENSLQQLPDEFYQLVKDYEKELKEEYRTLHAKIWSRYECINHYFHDNEWYDNNGRGDDKAYALKIKDEPYKSFFFALRNGKCIKEKVWKAIKPKFRRI